MGTHDPRNKQPLFHNETITIEMKGQSEIAYLPKFAIIMLIVMVTVITDIL